MSRRARSVSCLRYSTPGRELTPSIYEYGSDSDGGGGRGYSTRLNIYSPDVYGTSSRLGRATSVARFDDFDKEIPRRNAYDRWRRSQSVGRFDHLIAGRRYSPYGTYDYDYLDGYKSLITPSSSYGYYKPYYWYYTAPRNFYYYYPYDDWRYYSYYTYRYPLLYKSAGIDWLYGYRYNDASDRLSAIKRAMRDTDYYSSLRQLRYYTPSSFYSLGYAYPLLDRAREDVRRAVESRVDSLSTSRYNPRDYFGRTYVQFEKDGVSNVGAKYTGLTKTVGAKPSLWKAEDNVEMGYDLQAMNDDTVDKLYENQNLIDSSRESLLQDKAGIAPRMSHFDKSSRQTRHDVENSLRLVRDLKQSKLETFNRLSQPWTYGKYLY